MSFYYDLAIVWGLLALGFVLYNAHTTALKTNVSHAYLQIFKERTLSPLDHGDHYDNKFTEDDFLQSKKNKEETIITNEELKKDHTK